MCYCNPENMMCCFYQKNKKQNQKKKKTGCVVSNKWHHLQPSVGPGNKRTLRGVHPRFMRPSDACVLIESDACMSEDPRHLTVTERPPRTQSYFWHTLLVPVASLLFCCDAAWRHWRTSWGEAPGRGRGAGVTCDLGWSLLNTVLLRWPRQSDSQSVSLRREW